MDPIYLYPALAIVGALVGIVSAALGIGGGTLMVPAFIVVYPEMDLNTAKGSSLFIICFVYGWKGYKIDRGQMNSPRSPIPVVTSGSIIGGYLGGYITSLMPDRVVAWIFIALLGFAAMRTFVLAPRIVHEDEVRKRNTLAVLIGIATGVVSGATGPGGLCKIEIHDAPGHVAQTITSKNVLIATGASPRELPGTPFDGERVISSKEAMNLKEQPKSLIIVGAGAIGMAFAAF